MKKKFDDYQIRIVVHQNCTMQEISKLVRRYNRNKSMGSNQKALTWIPTYARKIKNIANNEFYKNCVAPSEPMRKNGTYEQTVANSVMTVFHINDWKKAPKDRNEYLEENSSFDEFEKINEYGNRIAKVCGNKLQNIFVFKDILCWMATFHNFTKLGLEDNKFAGFVNALVKDLHSKVIGEWSYDTLDKEAGTSDKKIVQAKIDTYTALMMDYLNINTTENVEENTEESILSFVQENANSNATNDDVDFYTDMVEDCVKIDAPVYKSCKMALIALMAYACQKEQDQDFESWIKNYKTSNFSQSQKTNYLYLKRDFDKFMQRDVSA